MYHCHSSHLTQLEVWKQSHLAVLSLNLTFCLSLVLNSKLKLIPRLQDDRGRTWKDIRSAVYIYGTGHTQCSAALDIRHHSKLMIEWFLYCMHQTSSEGNDCFLRKQSTPEVETAIVTLNFSNLKSKEITFLHIFWYIFCYMVK